VQSGLQSLLKFPAESWRRFAAKILQRLSICICKRRELDLKKYFSRSVPLHYF
jgi:hypothetical protein